MKLRNDEYSAPEIEVIGDAQVGGLIPGGSSDGGEREDWFIDQL